MLRWDTLSGFRFVGCDQTAAYISPLSSPASSVCSRHSNMKFLVRPSRSPVSSSHPPPLCQVVFSVLAVSAHSAPQLLYGGYGLPYAAHTVHAVPTVAKKTLTYKTAAFEPVEAATPADAKLISLKETEHSYDVLVPGPTKYVSTPVAYSHAYGKSVLTLSEPESF